MLLLRRAHNNSKQRGDYKSHSYRWNNNNQQCGWQGTWHRVRLAEADRPWHHSQGLRLRSYRVRASYGCRGAGLSSGTPSQLSKAHMLLASTPVHRACTGCHLLLHDRRPLLSHIAHTGCGAMWWCGAIATGQTQRRPAPSRASTTGLRLQRTWSAMVGGAAMLAAWSC